uniref:Insulin-like domain-containing protein n=1 Tax=Neogobius melanostomus TaxID=47308 RepID=A0A8C6THK9_9GOBI
MILVSSFHFYLRRRSTVNKSVPCLFLSQELCLWLCILHCSISLGPLGTEGAKLRCGSELIEALEFVCGDRGIYLGKRGYGPRARGRGIVDQCCLGPGCDLHHLEKYCAKAKGPSSTTQEPTTVRPREAHRRSSLNSEHRSLLPTHRRTKVRGSTAPRSPTTS